MRRRIQFSPKTSHISSWFQQLAAENVDEIHSHLLSAHIVTNKRMQSVTSAALEIKTGRFADVNIADVLTTWRSRRQPYVAVRLAFCRS